MEGLCRSFHVCRESLFYAVSPRIKLRVERERSHWRTECWMTMMVPAGHSAEAEGPGPVRGRRGPQGAHCTVSSGSGVLGLQSTFPQRRQELERSQGKLRVVGARQRYDSATPDGLYKHLPYTVSLTPR